jgi:ADP-ribosylglycohydrolase
MTLLRDRILGCWLGKAIGGTLGLPAEGKMERLDYRFYDPIPTVAPPNDDLELQLVWLALVENCAGTLTREDFARGWLDHIHYMWDEYGRCRWNLRRGVPITLNGTFENHFASSMGSPIRSEIWACLFPGDPASAAAYAAMDASLDHGVEGIVGEVFLAVMQSLALGGLPLEEALEQAESYVPAPTETGRALRLVKDRFQAGVEAWDCWADLLEVHGNENFTHAPLNMALTCWALRYGGGDFEKTVLLAVNGGFDTDCTAASAGATLGFIYGAEALPARWSEPLGDVLAVGPGIQGIDAPTTLRELTDRTVRQIGRPQPLPWNAAEWLEPAGAADLRELPGTIFLEPLDGSPAVPFASGELPAQVKAAGGATWTWDVDYDEPRKLALPARAGARLFLDGELILSTEAGLPYVPATHRGVGKVSAILTPGRGRHEVRLELLSRDPAQEASLLLAYPNLHLSPWTRGDLPHPANLPTPEELRRLGTAESSIGAVGA